jgi:hypothetical protein
LASLILGSIFLALTLYRYIRTRRLIAEWEERGAWWASDSARTEGTRTPAFDGTGAQQPEDGTGVQPQEAGTKDNQTSVVINYQTPDIENEGNRTSGIARNPSPLLSKRKSIYDRNLITRFSIGFAILM